jgi:hypothetical protein
MDVWYFIILGQKIKRFIRAEPLLGQKLHYIQEMCQGHCVQRVSLLDSVRRKKS